VNEAVELGGGRRNHGEAAREGGVSANRNALGSPLIRTVSMWKSLEDWAKFNVGVWHSIEAELRGFGTNVKTEVRGPSPVLR
jgi:hypothetical protein